ncbi:Alkaline phytoceramidase [Pleurostoma richardsiae]|uniref:Alkaline phytoceramidase n=1 Tax=Pleurostoma richardsiae TaxID=41990 RepID=A0AA38VL30_9PEZI|nr:Alkaline phytoceramidase [Pleurostoma richardsiae]
MDPSVKPFWGSQTSYLNFCEEDYVVTRYIAEFINTLSSLTFVAYGIYGLVRTPQNNQARSRFVSYCGLIGVGVCSAGYHMTLKYHSQMSDELSMHLLTTPLIYRLLTFKATAQRTRLVGLVLLVLFTTVMVTHMVMDEFLLHASTFGLGIYIIASRVLKIIPTQISDPRIRKTVRDITILGCFCFGLGYIIWLIDDWACRILTNTRHVVGLPLAFVLEFHGWWHILTAIGGYIAVAVVDLITTGEVHGDPTDLLAWPVPSATRLMSRFTGPAKQD